ncbi:MAG: choice-of-anchor tandem repeat NxxGxxAF-containing protein [Singulisphaera sp.]
MPARATAAPRPAFNTVALTGMQVPGESLGTTFGSLDLAPPSLSPTGQIVFAAQLAGGSNAFGLWTGSSPSNLAVVALQGQQAPGTDPGVTFAYGDLSPAINASGKIAAAAVLSGPGVTSTNDEGIWAGLPGAANLIVREGTLAHIPARYGSIMELYSTFSPVVAPSGQVAWVSALQDLSGNPTSEAGIFVATGTTVQTYASTHSSSLNFTGFGSPGMITFANNQVVTIFSATQDINDGQGHISHVDGIWLIPSILFGGAIAQSGTAAAGTVPGVTYSSVYFAENSNGSSVHIAVTGGTFTTIYFGNLTGPGVVPGVNDQGVWEGSMNTSAIVARTGDQAPGLPAGTVFTSFTDTGLNDGLPSNHGLAAMLAHVGGPGITSANDTGIWAGVPGNLHLLLRNGDQLADGLNSPLTVTGLNHFIMNHASQIALSLGDGSIIGTNQAGEWIIVARPGDPFQVAPGDVRTIASLSFLQGGQSSGGPTPFNDLGQVAFSATFTDGSSGMFVASVPEPATVVLASVATLTLLMCRRRLK